MTMQFWSKLNFEHSLDGPVVAAEKAFAAAKIDGTATEQDSLLTGIAEFNVGNVGTQSTIHIRTTPTVFPKAKLIASMQEKAPSLKYDLQNPILSSAMFGYIAEKEGNSPEYFLIQKRGKKTVQGQHQIQAWASAGFIDSGEHPVITALRELQEETGSSARLVTPNNYGQLEATNVKNTKVADMFMHYIPKFKDIITKRTPNPVLVYIGLMDYQKAMAKFSVVESYTEITGVSEGEVAGCYLAPVDKLQSIFAEARRVDADFSDSVRSIDNLLDGVLETNK